MAHLQVPEKPQSVTRFFERGFYFHAGRNPVTAQLLSGTHGRTFVSTHHILLPMHSVRRPVLVPVLFLLASLCAASLRADQPALIDHFANPALTARGAGRLLFTDKDAGGQSNATQRCESGVLVVKGELRPGRGAPAFISIPLLLSTDGKPADVGAYTGVRLRVKVTQGALIVQVSSADVDNFDFHSATVVTKRGDFAEVRWPFADLKRAWSAQTALNLKQVTSVNLVAVGMAPGAFAFEVDEIAFY